MATSEQKEVIERMEKLFPFTNEEDLKIYAILSAHSSIASLISESNSELVLTAAYSLDKALEINSLMIQDRYPAQASFWKKAIRVASCPFQLIVPSGKISEMVEKIHAEVLGSSGNGPQESKVELEAYKLIAYAKYIFDAAEATPYQKGILTTIINNFLLKTVQNPQK